MKILYQKIEEHIKETNSQYAKNLLENWENEKLLGCGALKFLNKEHGELKSIRVHDNFRNQNNGIRIINHLINEARKLEIKRISIETGAGKFFEPARKLFDKCNFKPCKPFAHYKTDINSIYLSKLINND